MRSSAEYFSRSFSDATDQESALKGWDQSYTQLGRGRFEGSVTRIELDRVSVCEERCNINLAQTSSPPAGKIVVIIPFDADGESLINGERHPNLGFLHFGGHSISVITGTNTRGVYITLDEADLPDLDSRKLGSICSISAYPGTYDLRHWLASMLATAPETIRNAPGSLDKILPAIIRDRMLEICSSLTRQAQHVGLRDGNSYAIFRRARQRLVADNDTVLTVTDLAADLGVADHVLRAAFIQCTGVSPRIWLRQHRLNIARRALLRPETTEASVARVAMACGFYHLGRFAAYYAETFHETPLQTLRLALG